MEGRLGSIPVNEFDSCIVWFTMKNMKGMKRLGEKSEPDFQNS